MHPHALRTAPSRHVVARHAGPDASAARRRPPDQRPKTSGAPGRSCR